MNHLHTIQQRNAQAIERAIPDLVARGNYVVAEYAGLHFVGAHFFSGDTPAGTARERAQACLKEISARGDSSHAELHAPTELAAA